jgi:hypothetical protein
MDYHNPTAFAYTTRTGFYENLNSEKKKAVFASE